MKSKKAKFMQKIPNFDFYFITEEGRVFRGNKEMSPVNNGTGYFQIKLRKNGKRIQKYVHRLVWETFKGSIPSGYEINHKDHDKSNNALSNLELVTHSENLKKAVQKHGHFGFLK